MTDIYNNANIYDLITITTDEEEIIFSVAVTSSIYSKEYSNNSNGYSSIE